MAFIESSERRETHIHPTIQQYICVWIDGRINQRRARFFSKYLLFRSKLFIVLYIVYLLSRSVRSINIMQANH